MTNTILPISLAEYYSSPHGLARHEMKPYREKEINYTALVANGHVHATIIYIPESKGDWHKMYIGLYSISCFQIRHLCFKADGIQKLGSWEKATLKS